MKLSKKVVSLALIITLLMTTLPQSVLAQNEKETAYQQNFDRYNVNFEITGDWGTGHNGKIQITNTSNETITDWQLAFDFNYKIDNFWTAKIIEHNDNHYVIKGQDYNSKIEPNQLLI